MFATKQKASTQPDECKDTPGLTNTVRGRLRETRDNNLKKAGGARNDVACTRVCHHKWRGKPRILKTDTSIQATRLPTEESYASRTEKTASTMR